MSFLYYMAALLVFLSAKELSFHEWIIAISMCLALAELAGIKEAVERGRKK